MGEIPYDFSIATAMKLTQMTCKRSNVHSGHTPTLTFETKNSDHKKMVPFIKPPNKNP